MTTRGPTNTNGLLRGENVIIFSSDDWDSGLKTSKYHIARRLARHNRVLFVNSIGLRAPAASGADIKRALGKLASFCRGAVRVPEGLHVYSPIVCPFGRERRTVEKFNSLLLRSALRWLQLRLGLRRPVVFAFAPTFNEVVGSLGEKTVVYYCIDDLRGYAGVDPAWFDRKEDELLDRADCAIASSAELAEQLGRRRRTPTHHVPHGVDWALFRGAVDKELPVPEDLEPIPPPRLGFYGFLSDEWLDYGLLGRMAQEKPDWQIVLIGRPRAGMDMAEAAPEPNIHFLGLKPFERLPAYTRHFDLGLVPFRLNELTRHSNPLKLLEYLSGGLPVVTTDIPEVRRYGELIHIAGSHSEFIEACERALRQGSPSERRQRSDAVRVHSWAERVRTISRIVYNGAGTPVPGAPHRPDKVSKREQETR